MTDSTIHDVTLSVTGMKCGGCEANVKSKLSSIDGVLSVDANNKKNSVTVKFNGVNTSLGKITQVITEAGFTVEDS